MKFKGAGIVLDFNKTTFGVERASIEGDPTDFCFVKGKNFALPTGNNFLLKSEYEGEAFKAEFLYFSDLIARVTVQEKEGAIFFSYVFTNEGKKPISLEEGEVGFFASFNDGGADSEIAVKRRLHAHVRVGGEFSYVYPIRNAGSGPIIALLMTKGTIPSYSLERGVKKNDRGEILFNFPATKLEPQESFEYEFALFTANGRWEFEDKAIALGAPDLRAYGLCGFAGETLLIRAPQGEFVEVGTEKIPFKEGECSVPLDGFGEKKVKVTGEKGAYDLTCFTIAGDLVFKRAERVLADRFVKEGPFRGAFCACDAITGAQVLKKNPSSAFSFAGYRAAPLLFLLSALNAGETFSEEVLAAVEESIAFYDKTIFSGSDFSENAKRKKSKYFKNYADYPLYAAIKFEEYLFKKNVSRLIEAAAILMSFYTQGERVAYLSTNVKQVYDALKKEKKETVASALRSCVVATADKVLAAGNRYAPFKDADYSAELVGGVLCLMTDAYELTKNDYYLIPAEDHLARLEAFLSPSLSYTEDSVPQTFCKNETSGRIVDFSPHCSASFVALAFARYAFAAKEERYSLLSEKLIKRCLTLFDEDGGSKRGRIAPKAVNDFESSKYEEISFGEDVILYHFNLLFKRRSLII